MGGKRTEEEDKIDSLDKLDELLNLVTHPLPDDLSEKINLLDNFIDKIEGGITYIDNNLGFLRGHFGSDSPTKAITKLNKAKKTITDNVESLRKELSLTTEFAARVMVARDGDEYAGNGKCYFQFVNVGMGDCTLITTPKGVRILIDCGSDAVRDVTSVIPGYTTALGLAPRIIRNSFQSDLFLNGDTVIDILMLSHSDTDHYNKLNAILSAIPGISIRVVYFGGADKIEDYDNSGYIKQIAGTSPTQLKKVVLCENEVKGPGNTIVLNKSINGVNLGNGPGVADTLLNEYVDPATGEIVIYFENNPADAARSFRLSVLASNVAGCWKADKSKFLKSESEIKKAGEMTQESTPVNRGSLVASITCFGGHCLICGDATSVTEMFMGKYFAPQLATVKTLRMGHHGSPTSSSNDFIASLVNMKWAIASTGGQKTKKNNLPKNKIMQLYPGRLEDGATAHSIWAYDADRSAAPMQYLKDITKRLYATGSNDSVSISIAPGGEHAITFRKRIGSEFVTEIHKS